MKKIGIFLTWTCTLELNIIKYRSIKVHDSWHAFMANTPNIWYPSPDRLSVHLALLQALFWAAAKRIRCQNHDELLHLRWVKHQSGCQPTRRRCSMVQKAKAKRRHVNETIQPYAEYFWILLICFFRARHEHIQLSDAMSVNLGARTGSLLASGITLCSSARSFGPVEPNIWKTWCVWRSIISGDTGCGKSGILSGLQALNQKLG